jgi:hypothetical protein
MRWAFAGRRIESIVGSPHFRHAVTALILINALIVGLETILKCALCTEVSFRSLIGWFYTYLQQSWRSAFLPQIHPIHPP